MATVKSVSARAAKTAYENVESAGLAGTESAKEQFDRGIAAMTEMSAFGKENLEAWVASAAATQRGVETLSARAVAFSRTAMENHMAAAKALMTSKSVQEFVEKQTDYARASFDAYVAELNSVSDLVAGLTKDAIKPLNERMTAVGNLMQPTR